MKKTRGEREKTEETLVTLVEKVIEKLKREMLEMNLWIKYINHNLYMKFYYK